MPRDVLDLGAGTGKLTTRLVERGLDVVAVDPIPEMLELLSNSLPETPALLGTAEDIPLPDDSVDAVLVAQAWHWFDPERAISEVARVLRPGGRLGLVWNTRDERMGWVKDLGRIIGHEDDPYSQKVTLPAPFTGVERHQVEWTSYLTPQALIDLVASRSYCITSPADVRTQTLERVRELLATHPALANNTGLALPYVTVGIRATLPERRDRTRRSDPRFAGEARVEACETSIGVSKVSSWSQWVDRRGDVEHGRADRCRRGEVDALAAHHQQARPVVGEREPQRRRNRDADADHQCAASPVPGDHQDEGRQEENANQQDRPLARATPCGRTP